MRSALCLAVAAGMCCPAAAKPAEPTLAQQAAKLHATAMSSYKAGQPRPALQMLEQFLEKYPTNERAVEVYMLIARTKDRLKDRKGHEEALDAVISRFYSSAYWWGAYVQKLALVRGDAEAYLTLLEEIAFIFEDAKADAMVESTHLKNEPWDRTLKEKGEFIKIDYMLAIDSDIVSMPYDEAKERVQERSEMYKIFGAR